MKKLLLGTALAFSLSSVCQASSPVLETPVAAGASHQVATPTKNAKRSEKLEAKLLKVKGDGATLTGDEKVAFDLHIGAAEIWLDVLKNLPSDFAGKKTKKVINSEIRKAKDIVQRTKIHGFKFEQAKFDKIGADLKALEGRLTEANAEDKSVVEGMLKYAKHYLGFIDTNKGKASLVAGYMAMVEAYIGKVSKFIDKSKAKSAATSPAAVKAPTAVDTKTVAPAASSLTPPVAVR
jgi:hypothetical protein